MTSLLSRIEQTERHLVGLHDATQNLSVGQQETEQDVRRLQAELEALKKQVATQQQQTRKKSVLRNGPQLREQQQQDNQQSSSNQSDSRVTKPGAVFTDVYGRRKYPHFFLSIFDLPES